MSCTDPTILDTFVIDGANYPAPEVGSETDVDFGYVINDTIDKGLTINQPFLENEIRTYSFINLTSAQKLSLQTTLTTKLGLEIAVVTHISESFNVIILNPDTTFTKSSEHSLINPDPNGCNTTGETPIAPDLLADAVPSTWQVSLTMQRTS